MKEPNFSLLKLRGLSYYLPLHVDTNFLYMYIMLSFKMLATNIHAASSGGACCAIV